MRRNNLLKSLRKINSRIVRPSIEYLMLINTWSTSNSNQAGGAGFDALWPLSSLHNRLIDKHFRDVEATPNTNSCNDRRITNRQPTYAVDARENYAMTHKHLSVIANKHIHIITSSWNQCSRSNKSSLWTNSFLGNPGINLLVAGIRLEVKVHGTVLQQV